MQEMLWFRLLMEDTHLLIQTTSFGAGGTDAWLVKTDAAGTIQWNKTYGGPGTESAIYLIQTKPWRIRIMRFGNHIWSWRRRCLYD